MSPPYPTFPLCVSHPRPASSQVSNQLSSPGRSGGQHKPRRGARVFSRSVFSTVNAFPASVSFQVLRVEFTPLLPTRHNYQTCMQRPHFGGSLKTSRADFLSSPGSPPPTLSDLCHEVLHWMSLVILQSLSGFLCPVLGPRVLTFRVCAH